VELIRFRDPRDCGSAPVFGEGGHSEKNPTAELARRKLFELGSPPEAAATIFSPASTLAWLGSEPMRPSEAAAVVVGVRIGPVGAMRGVIANTAQP
jgi:hypothetical protein